MAKRRKTALEDTEGPWEVVPIKKSKQVLSQLKSSPHLYDKPFPYFRIPQEQGRFSLDEHRHFRHDSSQLKVFAPPKDWESCAMNLREGYENMIKRDDSKKEYLDDLLRWIMCNKHKFVCKPKQADVTNTVHVHQPADRVFDRGLLTRLLCVPYENQECLLVAVIRFKGTYFMCEFDTEDQIQRKIKQTPKDEEMCAWGFKFEQYVTAEKRSGVPDTRSPVNNNMAFCSVARSRLGDHSLVFGAEVDCVDPNFTSKNSYIELKTSRLIDSERQHKNFCRFKLIKWWAQSYLIGIPRIICGFRDDAGVVQKLRNYQVSEIPAMVNSSGQPWRPTVCFNFLEAFFGFVKSNITRNDERCVYLFRCQPGCDVTCEKLGNNLEFHFLPEWFIKWEAWGTTC